MHPIIVNSCRAKGRHRPVRGWKPAIATTTIGVPAIPADTAMAAAPSDPAAVRVRLSFGRRRDTDDSNNREDGQRRYALKA